MRSPLSTNDGCTTSSPTRAYRSRSATALHRSSVACETNTASTRPPAALIHGSSMRPAIPPFELEPASNTTTAFPARTTCAPPSPTANIVVSNRTVFGRARCTHTHATTAINAHHPAIRTARIGGTNAAAIATNIAQPIHNGVGSPDTAGPHTPIDHSTSLICSHANNHTTHPSGETSGGHIAPTIAFGYATTSVAVDSGVHANVSSVPNGCTEPNRTSTTGRLAMNAARPAASAPAAICPANATHAEPRFRPRSSGIHASQRDLMCGAR